MSRKWKITIVYSDMMLRSKHCSSFCKSTVLVFTLSVTAMLLLRDLTSAPDDKSIGIEYCQKISEKVAPIPISMLHTKCIADTIGSNTNTAILTNLLKINLFGEC